MNLLSAVWRAKNHLGPSEISTASYNLGSFYRRRGDCQNSIGSLEESIQYVEQAGTFDNLAMGRRHVELAASYAELDQWEAGVPYVRKILPYWQQYTGNEAKLVKLLFHEYSKALAARGIDTTFIPSVTIELTP